MIAPRTVRPVLARVAHDLDFMTAYERADQARRELLAVARFWQWACFALAAVVVVLALH